MLPAGKVRSVAQASGIHLRCLEIDGVYRHTEGEPVFREAYAPATAGLLSVWQLDAGGARPDR